MARTQFQKDLIPIPHIDSVEDQTHEINREIQHLNIILDAKLDSINTYLEICNQNVSAVYKQIAETTERINKLCKDIRWKV
jgi:hypothetical protein